MDDDNDNCPIDHAQRLPSCLIIDVPFQLNQSVFISEDGNSVLKINPMLSEIALRLRLIPFKSLHRALPQDYYIFVVTNFDYNHH